MLDYKKLVAEFKRIGLEEKDVVFLHSSFKSFGGVEGGPQTVIDALISTLGNEGTLIVPRFNFDFSRVKLLIIYYFVKCKFYSLF